MRKSLLFVLVLALVATPALAVEWTGAVDSTWDYDVVPGNWDGNPDPDQWKTTEARVYGGDWGMPVGTITQPVIADGNNTDWGSATLRNACDILQTGGTHWWANGSGDVAFSLYNETWWPSAANAGYANVPATLTITGGLHKVSGRVSVGYDALDAEGEGLLNIWGDGVFQQEIGYDRSHLLIDTDSLIDIRDNGELRMDIGLQGAIDGYIAAGLIVNGGGGPGLQTSVEGSEYVVSVVPEPSTMLLLCLGLGSLALIRRK